jgi:hypothetical protein
MLRWIGSAFHLPLNAWSFGQRRRVGNLEWSLLGREPIWLPCPHRKFVLDVDRQLAAGIAEVRRHRELSRYG